jgi:hypothetical protein
MFLGRRGLPGCLTVCLGLAGLAAPRLAAPAESFDILSFKVPQGWTLQRQGSGDRVMLNQSDGKSFCIVTVFSGEPSTQDAKADFVADWKRLIVAMSPNMPDPKPVAHRLGSGLDSLGARARLQVSGSAVHARLLVVQAGAKHVPILFVSTSSEALEGQPAMDEFLNSLAVQDTGPAAASAAPPGQILLSELAGEWSQSATSTHSYYSTSTGGYVGSSVLAYGVNYVLKPDLTYTSHFQGYNNGRVIQQDYAGTYRFEDNKLVLQENKTMDPKRYHIIDWERAGGQVTKFRILSDSYPPEPGNINAYAEVWVRKTK